MMTINSLVVSLFLDPIADTFKQSVFAKASAGKPYVREINDNHLFTSDPFKRLNKNQMFVKLKTLPFWKGRFSK